MADATGPNLLVVGGDTKRLQWLTHHVTSHWPNAEVSTVPAEESAALSRLLVERIPDAVILQVDKSLEECARVCGASWSQQMRTVTLPLLRPGLVAAWLLIFIAGVRELGVSVFLMGPNSKVIAPAIVSSWLSASSELSAAMALLQTVMVFIAVAIMFRVARSVTGTPG